MLQLNALPAPMPAWGHDLRPGTVVLFRFPCEEEHPTDEPKSRTCLILEVEDHAGSRFVEIAYGTSTDTRANIGDEFRIAAPDEMAVAGIRRPTRFICARRVWVTLDHPGWDINPKHPTPVVGYLPPAAMRKMNAIRTRIHARRGIIADRRAARRTEFTVEHRRRRAITRPGKAVRG